MKQTILFLSALILLCQACQTSVKNGVKIKGKILSVNLNEDSSCVKNAPVFLVSQTDADFIVKKKTGKKGGFKFSNVPAGKYKLYLYPDKEMNHNENCIIKEIIVSKEQNVLKLDPIIIKPSFVKN